MTTGAERLVQTAVQNGVDVCFTNPGTTEMPLVAATATAPRASSTRRTRSGSCSVHVGRHASHARIATSAVSAKTGV